MANKLDKKDEPLPQDLTEGVDDDEWVRDEYTLHNTVECRYNAV